MAKRPARNSFIVELLEEFPVVNFRSSPGSQEEDENQGIRQNSNRQDVSIAEIFEQWRKNQQESDRLRAMLHEWESEEETPPAVEEEVALVVREGGAALERVMTGGRQRNLMDWPGEVLLGTATARLPTGMDANDFLRNSRSINELPELALNSLPFADAEQLVKMVVPYRQLKNWFPSATQTLALISVSCSVPIEKLLVSAEEQAAVERYIADNFLLTPCQPETAFFKEDSERLFVLVQTMRQMFPSALDVAQALPLSLAVLKLTLDKRIRDDNPVTLSFLRSFLSKIFSSVPQEVWGDFRQLFMERYPLISDDLRNSPRLCDLLLSSWMERETELGLLCSRIFLRCLLEEEEDGCSHLSVRAEDFTEIFHRLRAVELPEETWYAVLAIMTMVVETRPFWNVSKDVIQCLKLTLDVLIRSFALHPANLTYTHLKLQAAMLFKRLTAPSKEWL